MKNLVKQVKTKMVRSVESTQRILMDVSGEGALDTAITILVSVVLGALLLAGLYTLFGNTILPTLTEKIKEMFNYQG